MEPMNNKAIKAVSTDRLFCLSEMQNRKWTSSPSVSISILSIWLRRHLDP